MLTMSKVLHKSAENKVVFARVQYQYGFGGIGTLSCVAICVTNPEMKQKNNMFLKVIKYKVARDGNIDITGFFQQQLPSVVLDLT